MRGIKFTWKVKMKHSENIHDMNRYLLVDTAIPITVASPSTYPFLHLQRVQSLVQVVLLHLCLFPMTSAAAIVTSETSFWD
jgi:hypothetical protein